MAAFMASSRTAMGIGSKRLFFSCISTKQKCLDLSLNKHMNRILVISASFHSQRLISKQPSKYSSNLLACQKCTSFKTSLTTRWNSSTATAGVVNTTGSPEIINPPEFINPPGYIPTTPPVPDVSATSEMMEGLNALGEPTLASLGLGGYFPPGLVQQALELIHVNLGLPWWGSIALLAVCVRILMFPVVIKAQRSAISMQTHMPTVQKIQQKMTAARQSGDQMATMIHAQELQSYMQRNNFKPFNTMLMPLVQAPVFMSFFFGLRKMAYLPVESMTTGGILWFPDLTVTTPFFGLPLLTSLTFWMTIEAGVDGTTASSQSHTMKWFMRAMPFIMLPIISNFPAALCVYWLTSNTFSLAQVLFLKIPPVRKVCNLPPKPVAQQIITVGEKKGLVEGFKDSWSNMKASQSVNERQRLDEISQRKAAMGPIPKTYTYNPKKVQGQLKFKQKKKLKSKEA